MLRNAQVQKYLKLRAIQIQKDTKIDAEFVLNESLRYLCMSFGDDLIPKVLIVEGAEIGLEVKDFNSNRVKSALELIGKNIGVQAFRENVNVDHTFHLEKLLNERGKAVEARLAKEIADCYDNMERCVRIEL